MRNDIGAESHVPETAVRGMPQGEAGARRVLPETAVRGMPPLATNTAGERSPAASPGRKAGRRMSHMRRAADGGHFPHALPAQPTAVEAGGEGRGIVADTGHQATALSVTIAEIRELQAQRRFCIKSQSRCDRSVESFIARGFGYTTDMDAKARVAMFAKAAEFRRKVEKDGGGQSGTAQSGQRDSAPAIPLILLSAQSRRSWDAYRKQIEARMRTLAKTLPVWPWADNVRGLGELGVAIIIGEAGDPANYPRIECLWKRLGLAVIDGERQQRKNGAEAAASHGFNPSRRAEIWTIGDSLFRSQWRGAKDDAPAHPLGPYGAAYAKRKAATEGRDEWSLGRRDADARRVMTKALIEDFWKAWMSNT